MQRIRTLLSAPLFHVGTLTALMGTVFLRTTIHPMDDHYLYQQFIEALAEGRIDFSIPGFHGASFLALPVYLVTGSPLSNIFFQLACALLLIPAGYFAALALFRQRLHAVLFAYTVAFMPFVIFLSFRGFTFASFTLLVFITLWMRARGSAWAWLPFGLSMVTKPFSVALIPLFLLWTPRGVRNQESGIRRGYIQLLFALAIPAAYVAAEYLQIGQIIVGAHANITQDNVFHWWRLPLNAAHGVQMLFSIHNFYFVDPARTSMSNMLNTSPLLMVLGILSLLYPKAFWKDRPLAFALGCSALLAYLLAASLDHMDQLYIGTAVLLLVLAALPVVVQYKMLIPFVLLTLHFQYFYLYLAYKDIFFSDFSVFLIPIVVDVLAVCTWVFVVLPTVRVRDVIGQWRA